MVTIDTVAPNAPVLDPINATDPAPVVQPCWTYPDGTTATAHQALMVVGHDHSHCVDG
ncbi:hypothetical protein ACT4ZG_02125 [Acinetobacter baumannii]